MSMFDSSPISLELLAVAPVAAPSANSAPGPIADESSLFAQLMSASSAQLEATPPPGVPSQSLLISDQVGPEAAVTGKSLPVVEVSPQQSVAKTGGSLPHSSLEEFAVAMGIDRKLAQLLLNETGGDSAGAEASAAAAADEVLPNRVAALKPAPKGRQAIDIIDLPIGLVASLQPQVLPLKPVSTQQPLQTDIDTPAIAQAIGRSTAQSPLPTHSLPLDLGVQAAQPPEQTLTAWMAPRVDTSAYVAPAATTTVNATAVLPALASPLPPVNLTAEPVAVRNEQVTIAALPAASSPSVTVPVPVPLADEDVLRWRSLISRGTIKPAPAQPAALKPSSDTDTTLPADVTTEFAGAGTAPIVVAAKTSVALAQALSRVEVEPRPSAEGSVIQAPVGRTDSILQAPVSTLKAEATPVVVPRTLTGFDYQARADQFTEQVGQRMLHALRNDRWTVSVSLEPRNLGPIDIALNVSGNDVAASMQVANAQVQSILEQGLDKLRDSFAAAGYSLSDCSFSAAGGRHANQQADSRLPAPAMFAPTTRKAPYASPVAPAEAARQGSGRSISDIDLYV